MEQCLNDVTTRTYYLIRRHRKVSKRLVTRYYITAEVAKSLGLRIVNENKKIAKALEGRTII